MVFLEKMIFHDLNMGKCFNYLQKMVSDFAEFCGSPVDVVETMTKLKNKGVQIYTLENGRFNWDYTAPFEDSHKIATYCCHFGISDMKEIFYNENIKLTCT